MTRMRHALVVLVAVGVVVSTLGAFPLTNVVIDDNADGWFTFENVDDYGADLDERAGDGEIVVFTGHPSYVIASDRAQLLFDMPRIHYYASTFNDTHLGDRFYARLTAALRTGRADYAISGPMTKAILEQNSTAERAFEQHYCRVDDAEAQLLYSRTNSTLYRYEPACPADRRPDIAS